jgi:hypothetical protein
MTARKPPPPQGLTPWTHPWPDPSGRLWQADVEWGTIGGRAEPISVTIRSAGNTHPVTAAAVRAFPLAEMIRFARRASSELNAAVALDPAVSPEGRREAKRRADQYSAQRGIALSPEGLQAVADVYKAAYVEGDGVTRAVADAFGIAPSTAGKRIMMARRAGLLKGIGEVR